MKSTKRQVEVEIAEVRQFTAISSLGAPGDPRAHTFLKKDEERIGQYTSKTTAAKAARRLNVAGFRHRIMLTITYRDMVPRLCWTVVWRIPGRGDTFQR